MKRFLFSLLALSFSLSLFFHSAQAAENGVPVPAKESAPADPQLNTADVIALGRSFLQLQQQKVVLANLQLTPEESEAFWPVYRAYQNSFEPLGDRLTNLIIRFNETMETMTDDEAREMLAESQAIQAAELKVRQDYVAQFSNVLPPKKVLRFYQIDNKIRAEIRYHLSLEIPLLEVTDQAAA